MRADRPSATACLIAASLGISSRYPDYAPLVNPLAGDLSKKFLKAYGWPASPLAPVLFQRWFRWLALGLERLTIPGIALHYLARKRFLNQIAQEALAGGIQQVVILGAGFDVLGLYLHARHPNVTFLEVDYPATQAAKRQALKDRTLGRNLVFVPFDFTQETLADCLLKQTSYRPSADTLFIAEGVLMYLSEADVKNLFGMIRAQSGPASRFAFTFMEPRDNGSVNFHNRSKLVDAWMKLRGEPFAWGILRQALDGFLKTQGFLVQKIGDPQEFRGRVLAPAGLKHAVLAEGEYVCVTSKAS